MNPRSGYELEKTNGDTRSNDLMNQEKSIDELWVGYVHGDSLDNLRQFYAEHYLGANKNKILDLFKELAAIKSDTDEDRIKYFRKKLEITNHIMQMTEDLQANLDYLSTSNNNFTVYNILQTWRGMVEQNPQYVIDQLKDITVSDELKHCATFLKGKANFMLYKHTITNQPDSKTESHYYFEAWLAFQAVVLEKTYVDKITDRFFDNLDLFAESFYMFIKMQYLSTSNDMEPVIFEFLKHYELLNTHNTQEEDQKTEREDEHTFLTSSLSLNQLLALHMVIHQSRVVESNLGDRKAGVLCQIEKEIKKHNANLGIEEATQLFSEPSLNEIFQFDDVNYLKIKILMIEVVRGRYEATQELLSVLNHCGFETALVAACFARLGAEKDDLAKIKLLIMTNKMISGLIKEKNEFDALLLQQDILVLIARNTIYKCYILRDYPSKMLADFLNIIDPLFAHIAGSANEELMHIFFLLKNRTKEENMSSEFNAILSKLTRCSSEDAQSIDQYSYPNSHLTKDQVDEYVQTVIAHSPSEDLVIKIAEMYMVFYLDSRSKQERKEVINSMIFLYQYHSDSSEIISILRNISAVTDNSAPTSNLLSLFLAYIAIHPEKERDLLKNKLEEKAPKANQLIPAKKLTASNKVKTEAKKEDTNEAERIQKIMDAEKRKQQAEARKQREEELQKNKIDREKEIALKKQQDLAIKRENARLQEQIKKDQKNNAKRKKQAKAELKQHEAEEKQQNGKESTAPDQQKAMLQVAKQQSLPRKTKISKNAQRKQVKAAKLAENQKHINKLQPPTAKAWQKPNELIMAWRKPNTCLDTGYKPLASTTLTDAMPMPALDPQVAHNTYPEYDTPSLYSHYDDELDLHSKDVSAEYYASVNRERTRDNTIDYEELSTNSSDGHSATRHRWNSLHCYKTRPISELHPKYHFLSDLFLALRNIVPATNEPFLIYAVGDMVRNMELGLAIKNVDCAISKALPIGQDKTTFEILDIGIDGKENQFIFHRSMHDLSLYTCNYNTGTETIKIVLKYSKELEDVLLTDGQVAAEQAVIADLRSRDMTINSLCLVFTKDNTSQEKHMKFFTLAENKSNSAIRCIDDLNNRQLSLLEEIDALKILRIIITQTNLWIDAYKQNNSQLIFNLDSSLVDLCSKEITEWKEAFVNSSNEREYDHFSGRLYTNFLRGLASEIGPQLFLMLEYHNLFDCFFSGINKKVYDWIINQLYIVPFTTHLSKLSTKERYFMILTEQYKVFSIFIVARIFSKYETAIGKFDKDALLKISDDDLQIFIIECAQEFKFHKYLEQDMLKHRNYVMELLRNNLDKMDIDKRAIKLVITNNDHLGKEVFPSFVLVWEQRFYKQFCVTGATNYLSHSPRPEISREATSQAMKELPSQAIKERSLQAMKELPSQAIKERSLQAMKELPLQAIKERPLQAMKELPLQAIKERPLQAMKELPAQAIKERPLQAMKELPLQATKEQPSQATKKVKSKISREATSQVTKKPELAYFGPGNEYIPRPPAPKPSEALVSSSPTVQKFNTSLQETRVDSQASRFMSDNVTAPRRGPANTHGCAGASRQRLEQLALQQQGLFSQPSLVRNSHQAAHSDESHRGLEQPSFADSEFAVGNPEAPITYGYRDALMKGVVEKPSLLATHSIVATLQPSVDKSHKPKKAKKEKRRRNQEPVQTTTIVAQRITAIAKNPARTHDTEQPKPCARGTGTP